MCKVPSLAYTPAEETLMNAFTMTPELCLFRKLAKIATYWKSSWQFQTHILYLQWTVSIPILAVVCPLAVALQMYSPWLLGITLSNVIDSPVRENAGLPIFFHVISGAGHPEALHDKTTRSPSITVWSIETLFISGETKKINA